VAYLKRKSSKATNTTRISASSTVLGTGDAIFVFSCLAGLKLERHFSYGAYLGRVQGVGYVNELIARLTGQPVRDNTQTNRTLDSSPETFPLNRTFYADFSHDNEMIAIYSAMGLFQQRLLPDEELDPKNPSPLRTWIVSRMVPFSARMVVERVECLGSPSFPLPKGIFVRIFVNDAIQPLEFCDGIGGMCKLDALVESQRYARNDGNGDFDKCFDKVHLP
jgi:hypothetical protein